jgi:hypothetical protein
VTTSSMVGRSEPSCSLCPSLSFKDVHHPCWGGGRAEPELYLSHGFVGHPLLQHSGERVLTGLAEGADSDNAGLATSVVSFSALGSLAQLTLARLPVPPPAVRAVAAPRAPEGRPRRRALLGRRSCSWAVLPLLRYNASCTEVGASSVWEDPSGDPQVGRWLPSSTLRWWRLKMSSLPTRSPPPSALWASGSLALIACPRPLSGDVGEELVAAASALRSSLLLFGHFGAGVVVAAAGAGIGKPPGVLSPRRPSNVGRCSYMRGWNRSSVCNGTLSASVCSLWLSRPEHVGIFGCNTMFFPSFSSTGTRPSASRTA